MGLPPLFFYPDPLVAVTRGHPAVEGIHFVEGGLPFITGEEFDHHGGRVGFDKAEVEAAFAWFRGAAPQQYVGAMFD